MGFLNKRTFREFGIAVPVLSLLFFWFFDAKMNLWNTGITPGVILGFANILLSYWIYKNFI